uniref:CSON010641 protein n=1 Tax=Culicoides sonorensis TaxID=179676 RepID=A0A336KHU9_CULSO
MPLLANLFRSNSDADMLREDRYQADVSNVPKESLDCGITAMGWCNSIGCQRLGNSNTFLTVLIVAGILQGAVETYFRISAKQLAVQYDFDPMLIDWLLVASGITQGILAIIIAYWGNRIHRIAWIGGILMLQACFCTMAIIPTIVKKDIGPIEMSQITDLCWHTITSRLDSEKSHTITTQILLFVVQFVIGLGNIAFYCLGLSYLDDNLKEHESPAYLGGVLAARLWGSQVGSAIAFLIEAVKVGWWVGWTIITPFVFTIGFLIVLFPRRLLQTAVQLAANRILETMSNVQHSVSPFRYLADIAFWPSIRRLVSNKILMFNVIGFMFLQTAIINFQAQEENYLQSRFFLPTSEADGLSDEWTSRLITYLLTPPLVGLSVLVAGLVIAKINPSPRKLAGWNLITSGVVALLFIAYIFLKCQNSQIAGAYRGKLHQPYCSSDCLCKNTQFYPVCPKNSVQTYYSPCHAGCSGETLINNVKIFTNCTCGADSSVSLISSIPELDRIATEGACNNSGCQKFWITFQALNAIGAALLASGLVGNLLITIRSVLPQDKSLALSFEMCATGLFAYLPGKLSYDAVARSTCALWSSGGTSRVCRLQESPSFGNIVDILTASLILLSMIFDALVYYFVEYLPIYGEEDYYHDLSGGTELVNRAQMMIPTTVPTEQEPEPQPSDSLLQQSPAMRQEPTSPVSSSILSGSLNSNPGSQRSSTQPAPNSGQVTYAQILRTAPAMKAQRDDRLSSRTLPEQTAEEVEELNFAPQISKIGTPSPVYDQVEASSHMSQRPPNLNIDITRQQFSENPEPFTPVTRMRYDLKSNRPLSPETDF